MKLEFILKKEVQIMSWEEMYSPSAICPCGTGKITQKSYGDDWNRHQDGPVVIECVECAKKYKIEEEIHKGMLVSDGDWRTYYLTPIDYPDYTGIKESGLYPAEINPYQDFSGWLVENYTEDDLKNILVQLKNTCSSAKLTGIAARIRDSHKKAKKTVRINEIVKTVKDALDRYPDHIGNKNQRDEVRQKESEERSFYIKEKRKHQTFIDFNNDKCK